MYLECEGFRCRHDGEAVFDVTADGIVRIVSGPFHISDRKSGYAIICDNCGCEVTPELNDEEEEALEVDGQEQN